MVLPLKTWHTLYELRKKSCRLMLLNPAILQFDPYSLPVVIAGVIATALGVLVLVKEQGSRVGCRYALFAGSVGLYTVGAGISYAVVSPEASLLWDRIAHIGVMAIPLGLFASTVAVLGETEAHRRTIKTLSVLTAVFVGLVWTTDWVIADNQRYFWAYYPRYGVGGIMFVAYFAIVMVVAVRMYLRRLRATMDERTAARLKHFIAAILVGFVGAVDFLPTIGIELYAFGYIPIALFSVVTGYAILRYHLVDITPELAASAVLRTMDSAVLVVDRGGIIRVANTLAHDLFDVAEPNLVNRPLAEIRAALLDSAEIADLEVPFRDQEIPWNPTSDSTRWLSVSATVLRDRFEQEVGTVFVGHDVTRRKEAEQHLERAALYDELTSLPNRKLFFDRLDKVISEGRRTEERCAILYIDLDDFKPINDRFGHEAGDYLLRTIAQRLQSTVRASDTIARIGGDEFVVICGHLSVADDGSMVSRKIRHAFSQPIPFGDQQLSVRPSIGMALWPDDGDAPNALLSIADRRMYEEKRRRNESVDS